MFSLANFQVVHLVTSEFFQQGDLERTTLKMEPSVSTEGEEDRRDFGDGHRAETTNWTKGCGKIRVCPFICPVTLLNSQLSACGKNTRDFSMQLYVCLKMLLQNLLQFFL